MFEYHYRKITPEVKYKNRQNVYAHYYILVNPKVKPP